MSLEQILAKVRDAAIDGIGPHSTGEALMAALVLNRPDWLSKMGYSIAEALDRVGPAWAALVPTAAKFFGQEQARDEDAAQLASEAMAIAAARSEPASLERGIHCAAKLVTHGHAPGYPDASFVFDLVPIGSKVPLRVDMTVSPGDGETMALHLQEVHASAWRREVPLDAKEGEKRPRWVDRLAS